LRRQLKIIAPWRIWDLKDALNALNMQKHGFRSSYCREPYSSDRTFGLSFEGGVLEDPANAPKNMFVMTVSPEKRPTKPTELRSI